MQETSIESIINVYNDHRSTRDMRPELIRRHTVSQYIKIDSIVQRNRYSNVSFHQLNKNCLCFAHILPRKGTTFVPLSFCLHESLSYDLYAPVNPDLTRLGTTPGLLITYATKLNVAKHRASIEEFYITNDYSVLSNIASSGHILFAGLVDLNVMVNVFKPLVLSYA